jgi:hypothetical protein
MKLISSRMTFFHKRIFPAIFFGTGGFVLFVMAASDFHRPNQPYLPVLLVMFLGFLLYRFLVRDLADEVYDEGDRLVVLRSGITERIELTKIARVTSSSFFTNPKRVTLTLRTPSPTFGKKIVFTPPAQFFLLVLQTPPVVAELRQRIAGAQRG